MADIILSEEQLSRIVRAAAAQAQEQTLLHAQPVEQEPHVTGLSIRLRILKASPHSTHTHT